MLMILYSMHFQFFHAVQCFQIQNLSKIFLLFFNIGNVECVYVSNVSMPFSVECVSSFNVRIFSMCQ